MQTTLKKAIWAALSVLLVLVVLALVFVFVPFYHYSSVGLYPDGKAGSITQAHTVAPKTLLQLDLMSSRQMSNTFLGRNDIDLPEDIAVHVSCPPKQNFSLVALEYRIDKDWIVHPKSLQLESSPNITQEPYDTFICLAPIEDCPLPTMKSLADLKKVHQITIRATVKNTSAPGTPTYSVEEKFELATFTQSSPIWWTWIKF